MPVFKKIIRAAELPVDWARDFTNPEQLVVVTIRDNAPSTEISGTQRLGHQKINLAAPSQPDKVALAAMSRTEQKALYEDAILKASAQPGRKVGIDKIKATALKLPLNG